jgi:hypothetical protein
MWHHIKMLGSASDEFDDIQGFLMEDAGAWNEIDPFDLGMMVGADALRVALNYGDSKGPKRYEITGANDGMADTDTRSEGEWQFVTIAHTPFEPIDNLAFYGWKIFRDESAHSLKYLGWPLHALQDAAVPMHAAGSAAWGHRPLRTPTKERGAGCATLAMPRPPPTSMHEISGNRDSDRAFHYYQFIKQWRSSHPTQPKDIPVRELVTMVAQKTADYACRQDNYDWPFNTIISTNYASNKGIRHSVLHRQSQPRHAQSGAHSQWRRRNAGVADGGLRFVLSSREPVAIK